MLNESVFANIPLHKSAGPDGDGRRAYLNASGAFIGRGTPLLDIERDAAGQGCTLGRASGFASLSYVPKAHWFRPVRRPAR